MRIGTILFGIPDSIGFLAGEDDWLDGDGLVAEVSRLVDLGFHHVELSADLAILGPPMFTPPVIDRLRALAHTHDLTYSVHLHGTCSSRFGRYGLCLDSPDERVREATVQWLTDAIHRFLPLGAALFVLHVVWGEGAVRQIVTSDALTPVAKEQLVSRFTQQARRSLAALSQVVPSRTLCLENMPVDFNAAYALAEEFDTSICFDLGHWLLQGHAPSEFVSRYGTRVAMIHCHGVAKGEDHQALSAAQAQTLSSALEELAAQGFSGPLVLQVPSEAQALASLASLRQAVGGSEEEAR